MLGFSKREIDNFYDRIVEFSGLGEFINAPLRTYSTGMFARLGFSVATAERPDILIVDDTPENLTVLTRMLTVRGYHVYPALNGQIALNAVWKTLPDLILLDIIMPGMNGYEVCKKLKADELVV
jgi:CheY-like chemotaxis protein